MEDGQKIVLSTEYFKEYYILIVLYYTTFCVMFYFITFKF